MLRRTEQWHRGYDAGNYDSAYRAETPDLRPLLGKSDNFRAGYLVGFYSSYELHEVPADWRTRVKFLRAVYGEED